MVLPFEQLMYVLIGECYARRNAIFVMFVVISLVCLSLGSTWSKRYTSFSIIHADETNILQPLMQGTAEATRATNHTSNAREIIFGEIIMSQILDRAGWLEDNPSDVEQQEIKEHIRGHVTVEGVGRNLIQITYTDSDPERSYITAKNMAELYISEGERVKTEESEAAYQFIEKQVNEYLVKLTKVEEELRVYRSDNPDARPGLQAEVSTRISSLKKNMEQTNLQLREEMIRRDSIKKQLSGEAAITISQSREGQYRSKIADLQTRLESLRLDYQDTYPDIIRVNHQIEDLKESMRKEARRQTEARDKAKSVGDTYIDEAIIISPLYQQLRSDASSTETKIATLKARILEINKILKGEYERARKIHEGEAALSKLTRNYQVNQEIYQDLLRRREKARVSRSLDQEQQGLTFKIQEPAQIPLLPTGLRFLHFAAAGLILGLSIPVSLIYIMMQVDPRIRYSRIISAELDLPVLSEITRLTSINDERKARNNIIFIGLGVCVVFLLYGYVSWLKLTGKL